MELNLDQKGRNNIIVLKEFAVVNRQNVINYGQNTTIIINTYI